MAFEPSVGKCGRQVRALGPVTDNQSLVTYASRCEPGNNVLYNRKAFLRYESAHKSHHDFRIIEPAGATPLERPLLGIEQVGIDTSRPKSQIPVQTILAHHFQHRRRRDVHLATV